MAQALASVEPDQSATQARMRLEESVRGIVGKLEAEANRRVGKRTSIERRWIEDLEQFHGRYDDKTRAALDQGEKSKLFINLTRTKTVAMSARLMDLLFPTDDKNWGIGPTPVPELTEKAEAAVAQARAAEEQAQQAEGQAQQANLQKNADELAMRAAALQDQVEEGRRRSELMSQEIDDQLKQSQYHAAARDMIEDACKLGTGVCKGPVTGDRIRKGWKRKPVMDPVLDEQTGEPVLGPDGKPLMRERLDQDGNPVLGDHQLEMSGGDHPAMRHVDIWGFFPDMDARTIEESEGIYQRHLMNKKKLRALAKLPGFDKDAIRELLRMGAKPPAPSYLADLRGLKEKEDQITGDLFHVWEYSGPIDAEDMQDLALAIGDEGMLGDLSEVDPLTELNAIVWFCQGQLLKFAVYPYDSGECMYSVFNLEKDEASIFGYGIASIMRDPQRSLNSGWRMMMDNAGLSTGPQIVIDTSVLEPDNGTYDITPRKVWRAKSGQGVNALAFQAFNIPTNQAELAAIVAMSKQLIDDMTAMPQVAQGEQGAGVTKTAQGMALLMNSANVVFRRIVKNFDDDVTTPNIRRFYDWNMQFNPKEEIKGDFDVDARGSSVLLVREMQAQNLMIIAMQLGAHPVYGPMLKNRDLLRKLFQAHMIPADEVILSDDEIDAILAKVAAEAEQGKAENDAKMAELDFRREELDAKIAIAEMEADSRLRIEALRHESAMIQFAETMNMKSEELDARLQQAREAHAAKERMVAVELADKARTGVGAGGMV